MFDYNFKAIDEIRPEDKELFKKEFLSRKPVLIKGCFAKSKIIKLWSTDYFAEKAGDKSVKVTRGYQGNYSDYTFLLREYLEWLKNDNLTTRTSDQEFFYMCNNTIEMIKPELMQDFDFVPEAFVGEWYLKNWLKIMPIYYGNKNMVTPLHYDPLGSHNSFFQINGSKSFVLIPFKDIEKCYISGKTGTAPVDLENPDYTKFPEFKNITPIKAILDAGDLLYMPPYTLHYVKGETINISMNIEWHSKDSVLNTFTSGYTKRPRHFLWNLLFLFGLWCNIPNSLIALIYKSRFRLL